MYTTVLYLAIVNKTYVTVTFGWHYSSIILVEVSDKLKARYFNATSLSAYAFSTLYTTLPHNLIKDKLINRIERTFNRDDPPYIACNDRNAFLLRKILKMSCIVLSKCM